MGSVYEKAANGGAVSELPGRHGGRPDYHRDSLWRAREGRVASVICGGVRSLQSGGLAGSQPGLEDVQGARFAERTRAGMRGIARPSSLSGEKVGGGGRAKGVQEMKVLVVAQQKGGVGKTSSLIHLAFDFLERGLRVAVIDLDTQGNASYTLHEYKSGYVASQLFNTGPQTLIGAMGTLPYEPLIRVIEADASLANMEKRTLAEAATHYQANVAALAECGFDVVLVDTAPALGVSLATALSAADYVLSPIELEVYSIQGIKKMITTIANMRKMNSKLKFLGMVPSKVDARNPRHARHQAELQAAYPQLLIPASIGLRSSMADALATRVPVWKIRKTAARKAAREVRALAAFVFEKMEIGQ